MTGALIPNYARYDVEFERGEGVRLWDAEGNEYLDFLSGIAVCNTGHCHPQVVAAVQEQAARLLHVSNLFYTAPMVRLAERLAERSLGGKVFFANSGAEANEAALKLARKRRRGRALRRAPRRLPRPHLRRAVGDAAGDQAGALRPARPRLRRRAARGRARPPSGPTPRAS